MDSQQTPSDDCPVGSDDSEDRPLFGDLTYRTLVTPELWERYQKDHCVCPLAGRPIGFAKKHMPSLDGIREAEFNKILYPWMVGKCRAEVHVKVG